MTATEDTLAIRVRFLPYTEEEYEGLYVSDDFELYHIKLYDNMGEIPYTTGQAIKYLPYNTWTGYRLFPTHDERCTIGMYHGLRFTDFEIKRHIVHLYTRMSAKSFATMVAGCTERWGVED